MNVTLSKKKRLSAKLETLDFPNQFWAPYQMRIQRLQHYSLSLLRML